MKPEMYFFGSAADVIVLESIGLSQWLPNTGFLSVEFFSAPIQGDAYMDWGYWGEAQLEQQTLYLGGEGRKSFLDAHTNS